MIIIGAGPASISAAIQLKRSEIDFLILSEDVGGCVGNAYWIENLLPYPQGISGKDFHQRILEAIKIHQLPLQITRVLSLEYESHMDLFLVKTSNLQIEAEYLILGCGTQPRLLNLPGENEAFKLQKLVYEVKDLQVFNSKIGIIGSGDVAYDYALNFAKQGNQIEIIQRSLRTKAIQSLQTRVSLSPNISVLKNFESLEIKSMKNDISLIGRDKTNQDLVKLTKIYDIIFVAVGRIPNENCLSSSLKSKIDFLQNQRRLHVIGDIKHPMMRQISIAIGDGVTAAIEIIRELEKA